MQDTANDILNREIHAAAVARVAMLGPRWMALTLKLTQDYLLPATATAGQARVGDRVEAQEPLTELADPEVGDGRSLGAFARQASTVGDLLAAVDIEGRRVATNVDGLCAAEAARMAPALASDLGRRYECLDSRVAAEHGVVIDGGPLTAMAVLCADVAARLALAMVAQVCGQLSAVPLENTQSRH